MWFWFCTDNPVNKIILCSVWNPLYEVDTRLMHQVMAPYGHVVRIVIFNKNGVQVLVEFETEAEATAAKDKLSGTNIFPNCCTLRIDYSRAPRLNVFANNDKTYDFTNMSLPTTPTPPSSSSSTATSTATSTSR